jgi:hypothetical protein
MYCKGLAPGTAPGSWKSCGLEDGHSIPCQPVQQHDNLTPVGYEALLARKELLEAILAETLSEMDRLVSVSYYEQQPGFATGVEWGIGELRAAMERCERRHR